MNKVRCAVECFKSGFNCTQAILSTHAEDFGLDRETALKVAAGFGGGMGRMAGACGAVTGAFMVLGLKHGATTADDKEAKERTYASVREFTKRFEARHRSIVCRELLGCDISTAEGQQTAKDQNLFTTVCPKLVEDAAVILEEMLGTPPSTAGTSSGAATRKPATA